MVRWPRIVLIASTLILSWQVMMIVHEAGHVLAARITGGKVSRVVLHPLAFSRTDLSVNPRPVLVAWAGAVFGSLVPVAAWGMARWSRCPGAPVLRFLAGFCLIANGAYLAFGVLDHAGDAGDLLRHGVSRWQLWGIGILTMPAGLLLWHRLGKHFGIGPQAPPVSTTRALAVLTFLALIAVGQWLMVQVGVTFSE